MNSVSILQNTLQANTFNRVDVVVDLKQLFIHLRAKKVRYPEQFVSV